MWPIVLRLLRDDRTPLASEHPSQYGELFNGAAGVHGHWLLKPKGEDLQQSFWAQELVAVGSVRC